MPDPNGCPVEARSPHVAATVCAGEGHKLSVFQNGMTQGPNGPQMNVINFCSACGLSLNEVRGTLDESIGAEVSRQVAQRMAAIAKAASENMKPAGGPGIELVPDVKGAVSGVMAAKAVVESPS